MSEGRWWDVGLHWPVLDVTGGQSDGCLLLAEKDGKTTRYWFAIPEARSDDLVEERHFRQIHRELTILQAETEAREQEEIGCTVQRLLVRTTGPQTQDTVGSWRPIPGEWRALD